MTDTTMTNELTMRWIPSAGPTGRTVLEAHWVLAEADAAPAAPTLVTHAA